jgi:hypothetical protein
MVFDLIDQRDPYELMAEVTAHLVKAGAEEDRAFDELLAAYRLAEYRAVEASRQGNGDEPGELFDADDHRDPGRHAK